jgi:tripartite-type tricarboxylate transporter receptor subunit TctC
MFQRRGILFCFGIVALALAAPANGFAQEYPSRSITMIVGFAPGGFADGFARLVGSKLSERLGQTVVIENRAGGGGNIAGAFVANALPDGYTILVTTNGLAINETLTRNKGFSVEDLRIVAAPAWAPETLSVNKDNPAKTLAEFVQLAKTKPITFGSPGVGTSGHIAAAYFFKSLAQVEATHVPFQGGAPAVNAAMGGHIDALTGALVGYAGQLQAGVIRGLAFASESRVPQFPGIPTYSESGYPGFQATTWVGVFLPAKTSDVIASKLNTTINEILRRPDVRTGLASQQMQVRETDLPASAAYFKSEVVNWAKMIAASGAAGN